MTKSDKNFYWAAEFCDYKCALLIHTPFGLIERRLILRGDLPLDSPRSSIPLAVTEAAKQALGDKLRECKIVCAYKLKKYVLIKRKKKQSPLVFCACDAKIDQQAKTVIFDFFTVEAKKLDDWQDYKTNEALLDIVYIVY